MFVLPSLVCVNFFAAALPADFGYFGIETVKRAVCYYSLCVGLCVERK